MSGETLNITASAVYITFPHESTLRIQESAIVAQQCGESDQCMQTSCQNYADGKIARKELVNSLVSFLESA